ncbi:MAG: hypothetical protein COZ91_00140 [Candidatus Nealsonbacteria bacterium CG_4_8_14_3_um_filter_39_7]|uniref:GtrA/DPMS transmembrane domain-containing protein n=1 Tax=Candidatus Nealsonbacteria bacterium CG23_combo_of_CG06-09_8_20_14_all_39_17 TaxID=1974722 RepID=A0A2G9YTM0_9BACT|nr:MAG: hypothetical protein COX37_03290 [Candidatus Nealsonbacteria bacterium CG23_combo_of_CG06-09_8_20_14_all_39_17]PIU43908.1 MAG: hypothetical protein COS96_01850 [Candidatus Nealsonbacteria bacterium CG07_land_8_20_14_0_80_39_13]PIW91763.1 MAG: hypothetical protein COZ91_00140 [Candidatus Nealsonbacteria bacterium CG_4_8_14_3_um_filter_39_7]
MKFEKIQIRKTDIISALICGEISSWFLLFVVKNPQIEELKKFSSIEDFSWVLPIIFPILFALGTIVAGFMGRFLFQFAKFVEIGVLNTLIDFGVLNLLVQITGITGGWDIAPLNAISFSCAVINSYFWNKIWTFETKEGSGKVFLQFLAVSIVGTIINTGIIVAGTGLFAPLFGLSSGLWMNMVKLAATMISMIWNFIGYKYIVFKK